MLVIVMPAPLSNEFIWKAFTTLRGEEEMSSAIGIEKAIAPNEDAQVAESLSRLLADTLTLYLKTHNFHWNVIGSMSHMLRSILAEDRPAMAQQLEAGV